MDEEVSLNSILAAKSSICKINFYSRSLAVAKNEIATATVAASNNYMTEIQCLTHLMIISGNY